MKRLRLEKGWTQEELAAASKGHRTFICAIENGTKYISLKLAIKLADALKVDYKIFL